MDSNITSDTLHHGAPTEHQAPKFFFQFIIGAVILLTGATGVFFFFAFSAGDVPQDGTLIRFSGSGISEWYEVTGGSLSQTQYPLALDAISSAPILVVESVAAPNEHIYVLGKVISSGDSVFGIVRADGKFFLLRGGETEKSGLVAGPDGVVAFSELLKPGAALPAIESIDEEDNEAGEEDETPPAGTVLTYQKGIDPAPELTEPLNVSPTKARLVVYGLDSKPEFIELGEGREPRFLPDASIITLASLGIVRVFPDTRERTTLLSISEADTPGSALSPDGSIVAVFGDGSAGFYALDVSGEQAMLSYLGVGAALGTVRDAAFIDKEKYVTVSPDGVISLYRVPHPPAPASFIMNLTLATNGNE